MKSKKQCLEEVILEKATDLAPLEDLGYFSFFNDVIRIYEIEKSRKIAMNIFYRVAIGLVKKGKISKGKKKWGCNTYRLPTPVEVAKYRIKNESG